MTVNAPAKTTAPVAQQLRQTKRELEQFRSANVRMNSALEEIQELAEKKNVLWLLDFLDDFWAKMEEEAAEDKGGVHAR